ncbi:hypothetical protein RvY_03519 [Ramazzottius varieornatus]|uniref:Uncharacterized protein n=1 Tax=Ramazzottius varieornatus TaxID=947166 RepID=A0A1D1UVE6_RAMVA|nr:hypothetical protein RvY_03519 [Ramazzottius varieornatus]
MLCFSSSAFCWPPLTSFVSALSRRMLFRSALPESSSYKSRHLRGILSSTKTCVLASRFAVSLPGLQGIHR